MRTPTIVIIAVCCFSIPLAGCGVGEYERRMDANLSTLGASVVDVEGLTDYTEIPDFQEFEIRVPESYSAASTVQPRPDLRVQWTGPQPENQTAPQLQLTIIESGNGANPPNLDDALAQHSQSLRDRFADFAPSDAQSIDLGDISAQRIAWSGTEASSSTTIQGFSYVAVDANLVIYIDWYGGIDGTEDAMDIAYAAADSFRRKP